MELDQLKGPSFVRKVIEAAYITFLWLVFVLSCHSMSALNPSICEIPTV